MEFMRTALFLALPLSVTALFAGEYSADDRDALLSRLEDSRLQLIVTTESITHKQSQWTPDSNRWTILQVMEHIALTEDYLFGILEKTLGESQPVADSVKLPDPSEKDRMITKMMTDRSQKATAPEPARPKDKFRNRDEAMLAFTRSREKTANFVRTTKLDLRRYKIKTPMGDLDAHQWILMMAGHTERHVLQIAEVTQHQMYPRE